MRFPDIHERRKHAYGSRDHKDEKPEKTGEEYDYYCKSDEHTSAELGVIEFFEKTMGVVPYPDRGKIGKQGS